MSATIEIALPSCGAAVERNVIDRRTYDIGERDLLVRSGGRKNRARRDVVGSN